MDIFKNYSGGVNLQGVPIEIKTSCTKRLQPDEAFEFPVSRPQLAFQGERWPLASQV